MLLMCHLYKGHLSYTTKIPAQINWRSGGRNLYLSQDNNKIMSYKNIDSGDEITLVLRRMG